MIVQDNDVQSARSQITGGRLGSGTRPTCEYPAAFGERRPSRSPTIVIRGTEQRCLADPDLTAAWRGRTLTAMRPPTTAESASTGSIPMKVAAP
jgi:hypothetical protein